MIAIVWDTPRYIRHGIEVILRPFIITINPKSFRWSFNIFNRKRMSPKQRYKIIGLYVGKDSNTRSDSFWIEIVVFNVIASLRIG